MTTIGQWEWNISVSEGAADQLMLYPDLLSHRGRRPWFYYAVKWPYGLTLDAMTISAVYGKITRESKLPQNGLVNEIKLLATALILMRFTSRRILDQPKNSWNSTRNRTLNLIQSEILLFVSDNYRHSKNNRNCEMKFTVKKKRKETNSSNDRELFSLVNHQKKKNWI